MEEINQNKSDKEFRLSSWAVNNRTTVFVILALIFLAGISAYRSMPAEAFPEVVTPEIYVGTPYPGNSPLDIEKLITRPLEKEINAISGVDEINSTSVQGFSTIQVKFNFDVTPDEALRKVKDKVDVAKSDPDFPSDLPADPNVFEMNFAELVPILNINLSGDFTPEQLKEYAEYLEDRVEGLPEISEVNIRGVDDREVRVQLDMQKLAALELSFNDVAGALQQENVSVSGGDLLVDGYRRNVRINGEYSSMEEIENTIVKNENADVVYLKDIATVEFSEVEKESYAREYQQPVVMLDVKKRAGENLIIASDKIEQILADAQATVFPSNLEISVTNDQSDQTRNQIAELENSIIFGVLLVVLVLMFFLGLRNALFVGIAIPTSMLLSFMILNAMGITLNTMVLFSLVLALGMLVDNGIVTVENMHRLMSEGLSPIRAAKRGAGEVALAIIASTATTVAAFIPLAFWPGLMGEFMKYLPMTLIIVLSSSLFVALVINPVIASVYMKVVEDEPKVGKLHRNAALFIGLGILFIFLTRQAAPSMVWLGSLSTVVGLAILLNHYVLRRSVEWFQTVLIPAVESRYLRLLRMALQDRKPYLFFGGAVLMLMLSFMLVGAFPPKTLFFPENQPNLANVYIEMPIGTDIEGTDRITREIEEVVLQTLDKYADPEAPTGTNNFMVKSVIAQVGEGTSDPNQGPSMAQTPHKAKIAVSFVEFKFREGVESQQVLNEIRESIRAYPGVQISVDKDSQGPPSGAPISIEVTGDNYFALLQEAERVRSFINEAGIGGIEELKLDVEQGKPELPIDIDRAKARRLGVSTYQVGDALRTALFGREVSTYKDGEDDYPINIRLNDKQRYNTEDLLNQRITFRDQATGRIKQVPISAIATSRKASTFSSVKRTDLDRVITISSNVLDGYNPTETVEAIKKRMADYDLPNEFRIDYTGQQEEQAEQMAFLSKALMIAVFLIFLIMVTQFNSSSTPFVIMTSVVLSLMGVFLGLVIFRMEFVVIMTMIGIISLAGIVVNNAIVLIDYTNLLFERRKKELGMGEGEYLSVPEVSDCIAEAGKTRLRPVLLTAITTILGLVPLAIGLNIDFGSLLSTGNPQIYVGGDNVIFWGPMSWTIIFGLSVATFLTLVVTPVMYLLVNRLKIRLGRPIVKVS